LFSAIIRPLRHPTTRPMPRPGHPVRRFRPAPSQGLTIYVNGAWTYTNGNNRKSGCLHRLELAKLSRIANAAKPGRDTKQRITCKALSTRAIVLSINGRNYYSWPSPCGIRPNPSLMRVYDLARKMTGVP
jgi:hypothetical protein